MAGRNWKKISRMPAVVSDTSVLHYLAVTRQYDCLCKIFGQAVIPTAVWKKVSHHTDLQVYGCTNRAISDGWLRIESPQDHQAVKSLRIFLGAGESEAIILAREFHPSLLLMDDLDGRSTALKLKLAVTGTIGVLIRARKLGYISKLKPVFDELIATHRFRLAKVLYDKALREVGEFK
jgi:predicted nucleic acid-binding protein